MKMKRMTKVGATYPHHSTDTHWGVQQIYVCTVFVLSEKRAILVQATVMRTRLIAKQFD